MTWRWLWIGLALGLVLLAIVPVWAQDRGSWFKSLKQPGSGFSCCDISDCRRTDAEWRGEGWTAISKGAGGAWVVIPPDKVLDQPKSLDGDAYLCESPNGRIYCFVPPDIGS